LPDKWRSANLGDVLKIERGGSPRPIEKYITTGDGYNWIKIGDASKGSKYITKTAQKIKRDGLAKTRYVKSGDFLLSNSMSFGRPYILKIDGCIHDGWLVLHDENKVFDENYLYYLLSSKEVFAIFRNFASGSVVNNLNKEKVGYLHVSIPPIEDQKIIGKTIDDAFALLRD
jgi:type I restriction enzyme S subunit